MAHWYTIIAKDFFVILKRAFLNATAYFWDDPLATWNAISDSDWFANNPQNWFEKE